MSPEQAAQRIAEAMNGGEWRDGRWYTEGQRQAWIAAVTPVLRDMQASSPDHMAHCIAAMTNYGTGITRTTVDGCEQIDLEDYLSEHEQIGVGMRRAIRKHMRGVIMRNKS